MVQLMWTQYLHGEKRKISRYITSFINDATKGDDAYALLKDILKLSNQLNYQVMLPELLQTPQPDTSTY